MPLYQPIVATSQVTITGGGTLALGGFTLTVPATGTAALLATANVFTAAQSITVADAGTATTTTLATLTHNSSGTPAASFGSRVLFNLDSATVDDRNAAALDVIWTTATDATRASAILLSTLTAGGALTERVRIDGAGNTGIGVTPAAKLHVFTTTVADGVSVDGATNPAFSVRRSGTVKGYWTCATANGSFFNDALIDDMVFRAEAGRLLFGISVASKLLVNTVGVGVGGAATSAPLHVFVADAGTTNTPNLLTLGHNSSGTPAAGFGLTSFTTLQSSTTANRNATDVTTSWVVATDASRTVRSVYNVYDTVAREGLRLEASGSAAMIGFLGAVASIRQTAGANITNSVTSGGTNDTISDVVAASVDTTAADLTTTRNAIYQLARALKQDHDALRLYGLLT